MQTFIALNDLTLCALALTVTKPRLGKQRVECKQIMLALTLPAGCYGWQHHTVTRAWAGHRGFLCLYAIEVCNAWKQQRKADGTPYADSLLPWFVDAALGITDPAEFQPPPWWGGEIHYNHRVLLGRKAGGCYVPEEVAWAA